MVNWGQGAKGAAGGAAIGGTVGGPWGAAAGGVVGGALGLFGGDDPEYTPNKDNFQMPGYDERTGRLLGAANSAAGRQADYSDPTTIARIERARAGQIGESDFKPGQQELATYLLNQAQGKGPSLAMQQTQQLGTRNLAAARSMAAGARGPGAALQALQARDQMGNINQQTAQQGVMGALQERMAAAGQAGNVINTGRAQDLQRNTDQQQLNYAASQFNAGQYNQRATHQADLTQNNRQFNVNSTYQNRQTNDAAYLELLRQEQANAQAQLQGNMSYEGALGGKYQVDANIPGMGDQLMAAGAAVLPYALNKPKPAPYRSSDHGSTAFNPYNY